MQQNAAKMLQNAAKYCQMLVPHVPNTPNAPNQLYNQHSHLHHKFVNTLDRIAPNARVFRKSGSWRNYHADSALVWGKDGRKYILVALVEDPNGEQIIRDLVVPVENIIKKSRSLETT